MLLRTKRAAVLFGLIAFLLLLDLVQLYGVASNAEYADKAQQQIQITLSMPRERGLILDRSGLPLTPVQPVRYALCVPGENGYSRLFDHVAYAGQAELYQKRNALSPFLAELTKENVPAGIHCYQTSRRAAGIPVAEHLIGYLNGEGSGVSGLEAAYNELLAGAGDQHRVQCAVTARGRLVDGLQPVERISAGSGQSVVTTLDEPIQRACEGIAVSRMQRGCILVLECATAQVLASVSVPQYDPQNIAASIAAADTSLIDRASAQFSVGSVFKPVLAAAALEQGLGWYSAECVGAVEIDGQVYRCAKSIAHGTVDLQKGLAQSCNCLFIRLGRVLGGESILTMAEALGFGSKTRIAPGWQSSAGVLPAQNTLHNSGQLASLSFGQGQLMATPLQVAGMMNAIANGGVYIEPGFVKGIARKNGAVEPVQQMPRRHRAMSEKTAQSLQKMLAGVITDGIGAEAAPQHEAAAGKTGTAQTGRYTEGKDKSEKMDHWFAGFYPAENPQYTVVVLQDEQTQPTTGCAAIFAEVCNAIYLLKSN